MWWWRKRCEAKTAGLKTLSDCLCKISHFTFCFKGVNHIIGIEVFLHFSGHLWELILFLAAHWSVCTAAEEEHTAMWSEMFLRDLCCQTAENEALQRLILFGLHMAVLNAVKAREGLISFVRDKRDITTKLKRDLKATTYKIYRTVQHVYHLQIFFVLRLVWFRFGHYAERFERAELVNHARKRLW